MTLTIDLPEDTRAALNARAEFPLSASDEENIRQGLAQVQAGLTLSSDASRADLKAALAARYGEA